MVDFMQYIHMHVLNNVLNNVLMQLLLKIRQHADRASIATVTIVLIFKTALQVIEE